MGFCRYAATLPSNSFVINENPVAEATISSRYLPLLPLPVVSSVRCMEWGWNGDGVYKSDFCICIFHSVLAQHTPLPWRSRTAFALSLLDGSRLCRGFASRSTAILDS